MATLDLAGIITRVCTDLKEKFASKSVETSKQDTLVSGTNIKTVNGNSLLGFGNISIKDTDTLAYKIRFQSSSLPASDKGDYYRLWLTSADGTMFVPVNTSTSIQPSAGTALNARPINPFGPIVFYDKSCNANSKLSASAMWLQNNAGISYSYSMTLTAYKPVYLKCAPQDNGGAIMADIVQELPTSNDGFIYIFLGIACSSPSNYMELLPTHPVYWHDGIGIRIWTGAKTARLAQ